MTPAIVWIAFLMAYNPPMAMEVFDSQKVCEEKVNLHNSIDKPKVFKCVEYKIHE